MFGPRECHLENIVMLNTIKECPGAFSVNLK